LFQRGTSLVVETVAYLAKIGAFAMIPNPATNNTEAMGIERRETE